MALDEYLPSMRMGKLLQGEGYGVNVGNSFVGYVADIDNGDLSNPISINVDSPTGSFDVNNLRAGSIALSSYISSDNFVSGSSGWKIDGDGDCEFNEGYFRGSLIAGSIDIPDTTSAGSFHVDSSGNMWSGATTFASAPFKVSNTGAMTGTSLTIGGWSVNSTSIYTGTEDHSGYTANAGDITIYSNGTDASIHAKNFYIDTNGSLTATSATLSGAITSTSGTIGGWTLGATSLTSGTGSTTVGIDSGGTNPSFYAGSATPASAPFRVTNAGALTATNATLTGSITATSGQIGGSTIGATTLTGGTFQTATSGQRIVMNSTGIVGYDSADAIRSYFYNTAFSNRLIYLLPQGANDGIAIYDGGSDPYTGQALEIYIDNDGFTGGGIVCNVTSTTDNINSTNYRGVHNITDTDVTKSDYVYVDTGASHFMYRQTTVETAVSKTVNGEVLKVTNGPACTDAGGTLSDATTVLRVMNAIRNATGTCNSTGNLISIEQLTGTASGNCIDISNSGSGKDIDGTSSTWSVAKDGDAVFVDLQTNGNTTLGNANTDTITCTGRLIVRTAASDPQDGTAGNRPAGSVGEIVYYSGKMYFCTNAATPTWEKVTST